MTWQEDIWSTYDTGYQIPTLYYSGPHTSEEYFKNNLTEIIVKYENSMLNQGNQNYEQQNRCTHCCRLTENGETEP